MPKCGPLDDKTAEALGKDLDWASRWRDVANSSLPPRTGTRIKQIEITARKLESLLASSPDPAPSAALHMIEQFWPAPSVLSPLGGIKAGLAELCEAAGEAKTHRGGAANLRNAFGSAERAFIRIAARYYAKYAGRKAGVGRSWDQKTLTGPFVRFVREASRQFCEGPPPSPETIKKALADMGTAR